MSKTTEQDSSNNNSHSGKTEHDDSIVIHVCDESRKINRDFRCSKKILLAEMKYFKTYLSGTSAYDDIDISVHCDVHIFDWLMQYVKALHSTSSTSRPNLDTKSVVSILISSEFLEMGKLVTECLRYVHDNINSIIKMPIDLNCINTKLLARLSKMFTVDELETVVDKRNKIIGKLWMKKLEVMLEDGKKGIRGCKYCHKVFAFGFHELLECPKSKPFIDFHGNVIARHEPHGDKAWSMRVYIKSLRSKENLSWCQVYWKIWGLTHGLYCKVNDCFFPFTEANFSLYHPTAPIFRPGENTGSHPCCGHQAYRFDTSVRKSGCQARPYVPRITSASDEKLFQIFSKRSQSIAVKFDFKTIDNDNDYKLGYIGISNHGNDDNPDSASEGTQSDNDSVKSTTNTDNSFDGSGNSKIKKSHEKRNRRPSSNGRPSRNSSSKTSRYNRSGTKHSDEKLNSNNNKYSNNKSRNNNSNSDDHYNSSSNNVSAASVDENNDSSLPLRKWKRHSTLHYKSLEKPPTPEHYKVNPQRRRMWRLDLQREEDVFRMETLMQQLSASRKQEKGYTHQYLNV
jgi:hypothetical protein